MGFATRLSVYLSHIYMTHLISSLVLVKNGKGQTIQKLFTFFAKMTKHLELLLLDNSVTRFGEISPLRQKLKCHWKFYEGFLLRQNLNRIEQFFIVAKRQRMKTVKAIWSHYSTDTKLHGIVSIDV